MKLVIFGVSLSGKTTLKNTLVKDYSAIPELTVTSRPIREGEVDGKDYKFVTEDEFIHMKDNDMFLECVFHPSGDGKEYWYGTLKESWDNSDVSVMNVDGLRHLIDLCDRGKIDPDDFYVVYLRVTDPVRIVEERTSKRLNTDVSSVFGSDKESILSAMYEHAKKNMNHRRIYHRRILKETADINDFMSVPEFPFNIIIVSDLGYPEVSISIKHKTYYTSKDIKVDSKYLKHRRERDELLSNLLKSVLLEERRFIK